MISLMWNTENKQTKDNKLIKADKRLVATREQGVVEEGQNDKGVNYVVPYGHYTFGVSTMYAQVLTMMLYT